MTPWEPGARGFVVEETTPNPRTGRDLVTYWIGPSGLANGWHSQLCYSVAVFPSRPAARTAFEQNVRPWHAGLRVRRATEVEAEQAARKEAK